MWKLIKTNKKLLRALIPEAGTFKTIKEPEQAYDTAAASDVKRKANETNAIMTGVYGLPSYGTVVPSSPSLHAQTKVNNNGRNDNFVGRYAG